MMNETQMAQALLAGDRYLILTHRRPDGDTIGSAAALCRGLRQRGKQAWVLENPQLTPKYSPFIEGLTCGELSEDMTVVAVDIAAEDMLPKGLTLSRQIELAIDHHPSNSGYAAQSLVRADRAACGEIIFDVLSEMGVALTKDIAEALYVAISTDTGCFRYSNVSAHTFETAAALMAAKPDIYSINRVMFEIKRFARLQLEAYLTRTMTFFAEGRIGICTIPSNIREELSLNEDDVDDISGYARKIEGVELAAMLREQPDGTVKISLRSGTVYDAGAICGLLGGGGHFSAAGATVKGTPAEAAETLLSEIYRYYPELK